MISRAVIRFRFTGSYERRPGSYGPGRATSARNAFTESGLNFC